MAADLSFDVIARDQASRVLDKVGDSAEQAGRDLEGIGDRAESGGRRVSGMFAKVGPGLAAGAAVAGAAAGLALLKGMIDALDAERVSDKLDAQLGATAQESEKWGAVAGKLWGKAYGESFGEVNQVIGSVIRNISGMRGASEQDLERISAKVIGVGKTFDKDLGQVARATGKLLKTGLARDADDALDLIAAALRSGVDEADDLMEALAEYSTQFRDVGLSGPKALGLMAQALKAGARDADTAGDAIKEFAIRSKDGSDASRQAFKALHFDADKMFRVFAKGGPDADKAMKQVIDRLKAMKDPIKQNELAVALFGTKAEDLQDALFAFDPSTAVDALGQIGGAAEDVSDKLNDNAATKIQAWKNKVSMWLQDVATAAIDALENMSPKERAEWDEVAKDIKELGDQLKEFATSEDARDAVQVLVDLGRAAGEVAVFIGEMAAAWKEYQEEQSRAGEESEKRWKEFSATILDVLAGIVLNAAEAFSWIPGLGPKLESSAKKFVRFRDRATAALRGIPDETVNVDVNLRGIRNLEEQMAVRLGRREHGGPVKRGEAYIVGERRAELFVPEQDGTILPQVPTQGQMQSMGLGGPPTVIEIRSGGTAMDDLLTQFLMRALRTRPDLRVAVAAAGA